MSAPGNGRLTLPRAGECIARALLPLLIGLLSVLSALQTAHASSHAPEATPRDRRPAPALFEPGHDQHRLLYARQAATPTLTTEQRLQLLMEQLNVAWNSQDWNLALSYINQIIAINPTYDAIEDRHYYAHLNYGYQFLASGKCEEAKAQFTQAAEVRPDGQEVKTALALLPTYCPTQVYTATPGPSSTPVPTAQPTATPKPTTITKPITYTVKAGDTLFSIAQKYGTSVQAIMQANGLMSYVLRVGSVIIIPPAGAPTAGPIVHIVQPGETLYSIARLYNTTVWAIMTANGMRSSSLRAYRALFIPSPMAHGPIVHIVLPNETLYTIAQHYSTTVPLLMLANNLSSYELYVYQLILVPPQGWTGGPLPFPWPLPRPHQSYGQPPKPFPQPKPDTKYVVQRGDTLFSIARRHGTTVQAIMRANGLHSSTIYVGQTLRIP